MLKINKNNAIVGLLGFLPALLTTRLTSLGDILIFYVIMLAYTAFFVFCKEEVFPYENDGGRIGLFFWYSYLYTQDS